jgi:hypothetical protein
LRLTPSKSTRPFSQFFFPVKEESTIVIDDDEEEEEQSGNVNLKQKKDKRQFSFLEAQTPASQLQPNQQQQQQAQQQAQPKQQQTNQLKFKRHSLALDFADRQQKTSSRSSSSSSTTLTDVMAFSSCSNSSSRSSSLKTIRNQIQSDIIAVADENTTEEYDTFQCNDKTMISDLADKKYASRTNTKEKRLSGVARARTVLGFDSLKSRETRAIGVWQKNVSQLVTSSSSIDDDDDDDTMEIYKIMAHPALIVCITISKLKPLYLFVF